MNDDSVFISFLKKAIRGYRLIESSLAEAYKDSLIYRLIRAFYEGARINLKYSFLGRITQISAESCINNSKFIRWLLNAYNTRKESIINYAGASKFANSAKEFKNDFFSLPVKTAGILLIAAVLSNIFFSLLFKKEIGVSGWVIRGLLLLLALSALFCSATWQEIKDTSFILKFINTRCKIQN
jgi:hypothetical protein